MGGARARLGFGLPKVEVSERSLLDGTLPVIRTTWMDGDVCYQQEAYAVWLSTDMSDGRPAGDDTIVAMVQIRFTNLGAAPATAQLCLTSVVDKDKRDQLLNRGELVYANWGNRVSLRYEFDANEAGALRPADESLIYEVALAAGATHTVFVKIPFIALSEPHDLARLRDLSYCDLREQVAAFWRARIAQGREIRDAQRDPERLLPHHLMHMLVINDREPGADRNVARCGGFHYGSFPDEGCMVIGDLDRRGYTQEAERCLELYVHYQGTAPLPGNFESAEGVFYGSGGYEVAGYNRNQGWVLWCLAEHYRYTRDRAWLERVAPALVKGCDWITRERQAAIDEGRRRRPVDYGFLPTGSLEDVTDYWTWLSTNAYAYRGFRSAADVLAEIDHPEAARLQQDARAYGADLRTGFFEVAARARPWCGCATARGCRTSRPGRSGAGATSAGCARCWKAPRT